MKRSFSFLLTGALLATMFNCSKSSKTAPPEPEWLAAKKVEYASCVCLHGFRSGVYKNQVIYELYIYDPLCNGVNIVYKADGTSWFISTDTEYADYLNNVQEQKVIWTCEKKE
jgi:hypothetical protein